jgi:hypothetical protein
MLRALTTIAGACLKFICDFGHKILANGADDKRNIL